MGGCVMGGCVTGVFNYGGSVRDKERECEGQGEGV